MEPKPTMIESIFSTISDVIAKFADAFGDSVTSVVSMFYTAEGGLTILGTLGLIGLGIGLVYGAFRLIRRLMKLRG